MQNSPTNSGDQVLSADQRRSLRCLAEMIIPASAEYRVPSAADEVIFGDILRSLGRDTGHVVAVLRTLDTLGGGVFADLDAPRRDAVGARLREAGGVALTYLTRIVLQCYYRDDRVMRALDMEVRPPFPKGFDLEQGDWSLLDPVRARARLYREVPWRAGAPSANPLTPPNSSAHPGTAGRCRSAAPLASRARAPK